VSRPGRVFLSGQAVSLLGDGLAVLAVPLLVLTLTRSPLISGLSAASVTLGYLVVGLPEGVLVDRLDAWRVLVTTDAARTAAFAVLYLLWVTGAARLWVIMVIALAAAGVLGAANLAYLWAITVASLANRTYRQLIVPRALLGRVTSTVRLLFLTADPAGVVIAGSLTAALGSNPRPVFLGAGAIVAVTAAAGWGAGLRRAGPPGEPR
jgi:hypothetical protein